MRHFDREKASWPELVMEKIRRKWLLIVAVLAVIFTAVFAGKIWEYNYDENLQVCQYPWGTVRFINTNGLYVQMFGEVTTYPRNVDMYWSAKGDEGTKEDTSIEVVFSDAGKGFTNHVLKVTLPVEEDSFMKLHSDFGLVGVEGIKHAIGQHLATCVKNTGPMMTASEYQMQDLALFNSTIETQLKDGLYDFETVEQVVIRKVDAAEAKKLHQFSGGEEDRVYRTRVKRDPKTKKPVIIVPSPLKEYNITVAQYSQTPAEFDPETKKQIDARRNAYQLAEQAKASVQKFTQETTSAVEAGKSAVAKVEAEMRREMKQKTVEAEQKVAVAKEVQKQSVNKANQELATAEQKLQEAEQILKNSEIEVEVAKATAAKMMADANAERAKLEKGGALAPIAQLRAEQDAARRTAMVEGATQMPAPKTVIFVPSSKGGAGSGATDALFQMWMMRQSGMTTSSSSTR